ncbi:uncharacterized protein METZ01_LOCUS368018, partial [marine metagenome]
IIPLILTINVMIKELSKILLMGIFILGFDLGVCQIISKDDVVESDNSGSGEKETLQSQVEKELERLQAIEDEELEEELGVRPLHADYPQDLPSDI